MPKGVIKLAVTKEKAIQDIKNYVDGLKARYSGWYIGVAESPDRLFNDHGVQKEGYWIYCECFSSVDARLVEQYFLNLGFDGGSGGGSDKSIFVYAYYKTNSTRE